MYTLMCVHVHTYIHAHAHTHTLSVHRAYVLRIHMLHINDRVPDAMRAQCPLESNCGKFDLTQKNNMYMVKEIK